MQCAVLLLLVRCLQTPPLHVYYVKGKLHVSGQISRCKKTLTNKKLHLSEQTTLIAPASIEARGYAPPPSTIATTCAKKNKTIIGFVWFGLGDTFYNLLTYPLKRDHTSSFQPSFLRGYVGFAGSTWKKNTTQITQENRTSHRSPAGSPKELANMANKDRAR